MKMPVFLKKLSSSLMWIEESFVFINLIGICLGMGIAKNLRILFDLQSLP